MDDEKHRRRKVRRFTALRRARYLEVLGETGNRTAAAEAIGLRTRRMAAIRARDPHFSRACEEALEMAARGLAEAKGAFEGIDEGEFQTIRRGRGGRAQIIAVGPGRWSKRVEDRFIALLGSCGNVEAAARAVGFAGTDMFRRKRQWPHFEQRWDEALEEAEVRLEFRLAFHGNVAGNGMGVGEGGVPQGGSESCGKLDSRVRGNDGVGGGAEVMPFDPEFALKFLKWREEKRRGGGRRGRIPAEPSIEEVRAEVLRKVEAMERHRKRMGAAE